MASDVAWYGHSAVVFPSGVIYAYLCGYHVHIHRCRRLLRAFYFVQFLLSGPTVFFYFSIVPVGSLFVFIAMLAVSKCDGRLFCSCHEGTVTGKVECALTPLGFSVVAFGRCNTRRST